MPHPAATIEPSTNGVAGHAPTDTAGNHQRQRLLDGAACLQAALEYLALGLSPLAVCPPDHAGVGKTHATKCKSPGKAPWGPWEDFQERPPTEAELKAKWRANPTLNVGAALGLPIVRIDSEGDAAEAQLLEISGGDLPPTWEFRSGRKDGTGRGILYRTPVGVVFRTTGQSFADGELRFQAKGAQTVLPPSRHKDGNLYEWLPGRSPQDLPIALAPAWAIKRYSAPAAVSGKTPAPNAETADAARVASALEHVPGADGYPRWLEVGMALHSWDSASGFALWCHWSSSSAKYTEEVCTTKWASFKAKPDGVTIATVFKLAITNGWRESPTPKTDSKPVAPDKGEGINSPAAIAEPAAKDGVRIILDYLRERYRPVFRQGNAIQSENGEDVPMAVACAVPTSALIERLAEATDAPKFQGGGVKRSSLPGFFKTWSRVAWGDLLASLPEEDAATLGDDAPVKEQFRQLVREALLSEVTLGDTIGANGVTHTERRSLAEWCQRFAKIGPWRDVRSKRCWCKFDVKDDGEAVLMIAIRHELFSQVRADRRLCNLGSKAFARRAARYGVGRSTPTERPHGLNAIILDPEFVADLVAGLPDDDLAEK